MVITRTFDGADPEALQEHMGAVSPGLRVLPSPGDGAFQVQSQLIVVGELKAWRNSYRRGFQLSSQVPLDTLTLGVPLKGGLRTAQRETQEAAAGRMLSFVPSQIEYLELMPDTQTDNLSIPLATLEGRLARLLDGPLREPVRFERVTDTLEGGGAPVQSVLRGLLSAASGENAARFRSAIPSLSTALIDLILESLSHNYTQILQRPPVMIGPKQVRRAIAYIRDNPMPVLTTDELADICGVSVRSLQYTFRDFVGMTPAEYWRRVRLERAVDQMRRSPSESVSAIAAAWGFTNVTRFRALAGRL